MTFLGLVIEYPIDGGLKPRIILAGNLEAFFVREGEFAMVYTEPISIEKLIEKLAREDEGKPTKNILVVGCGVCANISCSYYQGREEPAMSLSLKPRALEKEVEIIKEALKDKYESIESVNIKGLCGISDRSKKKILAKIDGVDTVIVMGCPGGLYAVESYLDDIKIISGMNVKGFKSPKIKLSRKGVFVQ